MTLALTPDQLQALLRSLPDPAFVLTASGRYAAIYGGTDARYYHDGSVLVGQRLHDVMAAPKADWFLAHIHAALAGGGLHIVEYDLSNRDVLGLTDVGPSEPIWFEGRVTRLPFEVLGEPAVLWVASNTTQRHRLERQLRALTETDELTGLANRRRLMAELQMQFDSMGRYGQQTSVIYLDLDRFKAINDELGHDAGDAALRAVADALREHLRKTDLAARLGGDEFVVICSHTDERQVLEFAERLREPLTVALRSFALRDGWAGVSLGCATMSSRDSGPADVLRRADARLYRNKAQRRFSRGQQTLVAAQ